MISEEITKILIENFGENAVDHPTEDTWQVDTSGIRLLIILSSDNTLLRLLVPIVPAQTAEPYFEQLLEANFDRTQSVRYAIYQGVLWGVFHDNFQTLTPKDFQDAISQLVYLHQIGLDEAFNLLIETRVRQIIAIAKQQGQSLQATLQNLTRFYEEGMLGGLQQEAQEREQFLAAWKYQLERLWDEEV